MLDSTIRIYEKYGLEDKKRSSELARKTLSQIHREYLETLFTAANRHRLDIWDFAQQFLESDFSLVLDKPETMLSLAQDELFRDFQSWCMDNDVQIEQAETENKNMNYFRELSPEGRWLAAIYSKWHAETGEAGCEIAERAPASLLRKIHKKAMLRADGEIVALLLDYSEKEAAIDSRDFDKLEESLSPKG